MPRSQWERHALRPCSRPRALRLKMRCVKRRCVVNCLHWVHRALRYVAELGNMPLGLRQGSAFVHTYRMTHYAPCAGAWLALEPICDVSIWYEHNYAPPLPHHITQVKPNAVRCDFHVRPALAHPPV